MLIGFDETGTTAKDHSGYNHHGTMYSSTTITDLHSTSSCKIGFCGNFDGVDDYVYVPYNIYSDNMSLILWVRPSVINDGYYHGFAGYQGASGYFRPFNLWVAPSGGGLHWWISKSDNLQYHAGTISNFFTEANIWYHIAFIKDGVTLKIYKNGLPISLPNSPFSDLYKPNTFWIGRVANFFKGLIDEVRIYNRALSADEIKALYEATK